MNPLAIEDTPIDERTLAPDPEEPMRLERARPDPLKLTTDEKQKIVERVKAFAREAEDARIDDKKHREQLYAKLMQWAEPDRGPWEDSTNVTLPDILTAVLRTEDTLMNAGLTSRPMVSSRATRNADMERQRKTDWLLDTQFFVEQPGERNLEQMVMAMVRDGTLTNYIRWVTEERKIVQVREFDPIPLGEVPERYFRRILQQRFKTMDFYKLDDEGWDWKVIDLDKNKLEVRFYTKKKDYRVEMEIRGAVTAFDGPLVQSIPYESLLHPYYCANLQPPSPRNPNGAEYVIIVDKPTIDEIRRLVDADYYDLVSFDDVEKEGLEGTYLIDRPEFDLERQKDEMRGFSDVRSQRDQDTRNLHRTIRYTCFDLWAKDGTGESMDVVWTVLPELDKLVRARHLSELMPGNPPERPFAEGIFVPIQDRRVGMSLPELMEGLHDFMTQVFCNMGDACQMEMQPFGTYKPNSNVNPEEYRIFPGAMLPRSGPDDIRFEKIQPTAAAIGINELTIAQTLEEKLTSIGDLQFGRIPTGKSAALRTSGGVNQLLQQGEARPERILRRFFLCIRDTYKLMWRLNKEFLTDTKRFRLVGVGNPNEDPFIEFTHEDLAGDFEFDFTANVLNTSKAALQDSYNQLLTLLLNPFMLQLGITQPEGIYRLLVDYSRSLGQITPEKYASEPAPGAREPKLFAPEALSTILRGEMPFGNPAEPMAQEHLQSLQKLVQRTDDEGVMLLQTLEPFHQQLLKAWMLQVQQKIQEQTMQAQMQQNAGDLAQQLQQPGSGPKKPPKPGKPGPGPVARNDVMDESMPQSGTPQGNK